MAPAPGRIPRRDAPTLEAGRVTATMLGAIWTFNVFVVIYVVTGGGPNFTTDNPGYFSPYNWGIIPSQYAIGATYAVFILMMLLVFSAFYRRLLKARRRCTERPTKKSFLPGA